MEGKKILIKEIDKFASKNFRNKTISEYIIYFIDGDVKISAHTEYGEQAKKDRVNTILLTNFPSTITKDDCKSIIEEITN
jgi:hypothetical protein